MVRNKNVSTGAIIISTFANEKSLRDIAHEMIVNAKLCACVNYTKVRSLYWWENRLNDEEEFIALFKTTKKKARELRNRIEKQHPYNIPEILEISVDKASKPYLDWLIGSTSTVIRDTRRRRLTQ
ncbi:MAG: divalent-cation tolerance protein CutA [Nitrososphaeraceae archaeon]|jgi:periplasmic divalent cation tolerance protein